MTNDTNNQLLLTGLDGGNPLGYLAAIGTLRTLTLALPLRDIRLSWRQRQGWHPVVHASGKLVRHEVTTSLDRQLRDPTGQQAFAIADDLTLTPEEFRHHAERSVAVADGDRRFADFVAAFGCEATVTEGRIQDTALRTMSGAGHQHFLKFMRELATTTDVAHLDSALFEMWRYEDPGPSMRWNPADDRRYALRARDPSGDSIKTVRGANRLAIEALPLMPTAPVGSGLLTTGFTRSGRNTYWTWPIWAAAVGLDAVRSLLALAELQEAVPPRALLKARGITDVYRAQRVTVGKFRSFTMGRPV